MSLVVSYGIRRAIAAPRATSTRTLASVLAPQRGFRSETRPWTCPECRKWRYPRSTFSAIAVRDHTLLRKSFSTSVQCLEEGRKPLSSTGTTPPIEQRKASEDLSASSSASLPSQTEERRWQTSKRMAHVMDVLLARASVAGQHINVYTGTDYSGIEALRKDITEQEQKVRHYHRTVDTARSAHREAHAQQGSAQKEIVSLLERKSSWSPADLERYMSLVRSEHVNEQAVQTAKDGLAAAERDLESVRSLLERLERKQYHEEQIWSDTIRRNSTWVTFGLMGVNIILLLAQIAIFEPYRRRKIVKDVQKALDEKTMASTEVERQVDEVVEPSRVPLEAFETADTAGSTSMPQQSTDTFVPPQSDAGKTPLGTGEPIPDEAVQISDTPLPSRSQRTQLERWSIVLEAYKESFQDLFSERIVQLKRVDVTTTALQGAATGVAAMGLLFVVFRPR